MHKFILVNFSVGILFLLLSFPSTESYVNVASPVKVKIEIKSKPKIIHHIKAKYIPPTGKALLIAQEAAKQTSYPVNTISRIMFAESQYNSNARHINKDKSTDIGLFQINSSHIPEAKRLGIDIFTDEGNAQFAIYLLNTQGLNPWRASKSNWEV